MTKRTKKQTRRVIELQEMDHNWYESEDDDANLAISNNNSEYLVPAMRRKTWSCYTRKSAGGEYQLRATKPTKRGIVEYTTKLKNAKIVFKPNNAISRHMEEAYAKFQREMDEIRQQRKTQ